MRNLLRYLKSLDIAVFSRNISQPSVVCFDVFMLLTLWVIANYIGCLVTETDCCFQKLQPRVDKKLQRYDASPQITIGS